MEIVVVVDKVPTFQISVNKRTTIGGIKSLLEKYKGNNIQMFLNNETELNVFDTDKYDKKTLASAWKKLNKPSIVVTSKAPKEKLLTGQKDPNLVILDKLDDKSLISFCLVNKAANELCSNDDFWRNRFIRKAGEESLQYKSPEKTWKQFYLQILKYWDPNNNEAMKAAAKAGHKDVVDFFISKGSKYWQGGMEGAAEGGHKDLVDFFISKGAKYWQFGLQAAAKGGHKDLVDFFISKGARWWDMAMYSAAEGGHKDLVDFFISKGASDWQLGREGAAAGKQRELYNFFLRKLGLIK